MKIPARVLNPKYGKDIRIKGSSAIKSIAYDAAIKALRITFQGGNSARYRDVPEKIIGEFTNAASAGSYFNTYIKHNYQTI